MTTALLAALAMAVPASAAVSTPTWFQLHPASSPPGTEDGVTLPSGRGQTSPACRSQTVCTARTPAQARGRVRIAASVNGLSAAPRAGDWFTYRRA